MLRLAATLAFAATATAMPVTLQSQHMSRVGRQEWWVLPRAALARSPLTGNPLKPSSDDAGMIGHRLMNHTVVEWEPKETAFVIVDMWNVHWCHSATTRVGEIATKMNHTLEAARSGKKTRTPTTT